MTQPSIADPARSTLRWLAERVGCGRAAATLGRCRSSRRRAPGRGYTVVEVMMALAVLGIGAAGVVSMQRTTLVGNVRGRNLATANAIAATWMARVRNDAYLWRLSETGQNTIGSTKYLNVVGTGFPAIAASEGIWNRPAPDAAQDISPQADVRGRDTFDDTEAAFCTHLRMQQILPNMIRVEVRVFWLRNRGGGTIGGNQLCADNRAYIDAVDAALERYHFVYLTSSVMRH